MPLFKLNFNSGTRHSNAPTTRTCFTFYPTPPPPRRRCDTRRGDGKERLAEFRCNVNCHCCCVASSPLSQIIDRQCLSSDIVTSSIRSHRKRHRPQYSSIHNLSCSVQTLLNGNGALMCSGAGYVLSKHRFDAVSFAHQTCYRQDGL